MKRLFFLSRKERGFTLAEVIVATAIISFVILATWRVITSSLHSITRQDQKMKALHISQAHLARLEAEAFSKVVPENWKIAGSGGEYKYRLNIYDDEIPSDKILIVPDENSWYDDGNPDTQDLGFDVIGQVTSDGILVADKAGTPYTRVSTPLASGQYSWNSTTLTVTFSPDNVGEEIQIYYRYYHLVDEGGTIPSSDGEAEVRKKGVIRLVTDPGDVNNIVVEEIDSKERIEPSGYSSSTRELSFNASDEGKSVWIYYLPNSGTDSSGPDGSPDGYLDPTENSIVGVVAGNFWDLDDRTDTPQITRTKKITLAEHWRQGGQIQEGEHEAHIVDR